MTPTCILINGPKGVGKDTAALAIKSNRANVIIEPIMTLAKRVAIERAGLDVKIFFPLFETFKDTAFAELKGKTPRQLYIAYGEAARARDPAAIVKAWQVGIRGYLAAGATTVLVPDVRFFPEFGAALALFKPADVLLLRIYKAPPVRWTDGLPFEGDIGSYFQTGVMWGHQEQTIVNDLSLEHYQAEASIVGNGFIARRRIANER